MTEIETIQSNSEIKEAFGDFDILNKVEVIDHPAIYLFARIVCNYLKMERISA